MRKVHILFLMKRIKYKPRCQISAKNRHIHGKPEPRVVKTVQADKADHIGRAWVIADQEQGLRSYPVFGGLKVGRRPGPEGIAGEKTDKNRQIAARIRAFGQISEKRCQEDKGI